MRWDRKGRAPPRHDIFRMVEGNWTSGSNVWRVRIMMFTVCFVTKGGKEVRIKFFIFIYIYILDAEFLFYTFERGIDKFPRDLWAKLWIALNRKINFNIQTSKIDGIYFKYLFYNNKILIVNFIRIYKPYQILQIVIF